jgi:diguanylate cyclase (GGDEF)-like protein
MTRSASIYIALMFTTGAVIAGAALADLISSSGSAAAQPWRLFLLITCLAALAQLFNAEAPNHQLYHPALVFLFAGAVLFEPGLFTLLVLISHLVEWIKERVTGSRHLRAWYIQPFNISMHIFLGALVHGTILWLNPHRSALDTLPAVAALSVAAAAYTLLNHLIVGQVLVLARGIPWKVSGILNPESLSTDFVLLAQGWVIAILVRLNPWLILPALTPLYLIYRALAVPQLKQQAHRDAKTGLWNAEFFMKALEAETNRSNRFGHPLTVVIADLDLLRNINNAYGHLAGDAVLVGVANILRQYVREYDVVSRFGGEEFAILMPEVQPENAYLRIESIRRAIEEAVFISPASQAEIRATMSFGIAGSVPWKQTPKELVHCADIAVYQAKMSGRNRTCIFSKEEACLLGVFQPESREVGINHHS